MCAARVLLVDRRKENPNAAQFSFLSADFVGPSANQSVGEPARRSFYICLLC